MIAVKGISKLSGQAKSNTYPQAEGVLADCMLIYGKRLGEDTSLFGEFSILILSFFWVFFNLFLSVWPFFHREKCHPNLSRCSQTIIHDHHHLLKLSLTLFKAQALVEFGDSLKQMADVKYALDDNVKQNFLEPLHQLQMKDLKEVMVSFGSF